YFYDSTIGTDSMALALNQYSASNPGTTVFSTTSNSTFVSELATGKYNLVAYFVQDWYPTFFPAGTAALKAYVAGGGKAIVTDWASTLGSDFIAPFGASFSGPVNKGQFMVTAPGLTPAG